MPDRNERTIRFLSRNMALILLVTTFLFFALFAPNFLSVYNIRSILKGSSLSGIAAIGFTLIIILGQLDLSIGAVLMLSGMLCIGLQPSLGWAGSMAAAVLSGTVIGLVNGLLVARAKINSFVVTLGTQIITFGIMHLYSRGGSLHVADFTLADWLDKPVLLLFTPMTLITLTLVLISAFLLTQTGTGRSFFIVGGSPESAWLAGLHRDRYIIAGFILCGGLAALGGALFAISISSMTSYAILGSKTLMQVISAVIIGGTLMTGGRGSIIKSYFAVLFLIAINNGIGCFGLGFEVQIFINGLILALVVLYEAWSVNHYNKRVGRRPDLMKNLDKKGAPYE